MTDTASLDRLDADQAAALLARYDQTRAEIAAAAKAAERPDGSVTLVAVSKTYGPEYMRPLLEAGQRIFGENRVQEAHGKWPALKAEYPDIELHLIGPLQTNKARDAVALFDVIQSVDRESLAETLAKEMTRAARALPCYIQINTGEEPQKAGVLPAEADAFIERARGHHGLDIVGLMCIPPADEIPAPHFALLGTIAKRHGLTRLSMGMSADYQAAIRMGATHVRVGSAIFGARNVPA